MSTDRSQIGRNVLAPFTTVQEKNCSAVERIRIWIIHIYREKIVGVKVEEARLGFSVIGIVCTIDRTLFSSMFMHCEIFARHNLPKLFVKLHRER